MLNYVSPATGTSYLAHIEATSPRLARMFLAKKVEFWSRNGTGPSRVDAIVKQDRTVFSENPRTRTGRPVGRPVPPNILTPPDLQDTWRDQTNACNDCAVHYARYEHVAQLCQMRHRELDGTVALDKTLPPTDMWIRDVSMP